MPFWFRNKPQACKPKNEYLYNKKNYGLLALARGLRWATRQRGVTLKSYKIKTKIMVSTKIKIGILSLLILLLLTTALLAWDKIYIGYVVLFKRTALLNHYNSAGQWDGEIKGYIDGNIYVSANFSNGLRDGLTTTYFTNGQIKNMSFFKKNKREGSEVGYYADGKMNYKGSWKNNKKYGSAYHYSADGKLTNYDGLDVVNLFFYMEYDGSGKTIPSFGSSFSSNIFSYDVKTDSIILLIDNHSYQNINNLNITVATPPDLTPQINLLINDKPVKDFKIKDNTINIKDAFLNKGLYNLKITGALLNQKNRRVRKTDTLFLTITKN